MIGIVVVSHSHALAQAAVGLASEMVPEDGRPAIAVAAGLDETTFGTDAVAVAEAIAAVASEDGVLVLMDLGSAVLSAEMALEFVDPDVAAGVRLTSAPLVEGLVAAVVTAATGADLAGCEAEALRGLVGKREHLGEADAAPAEPVGPAGAFARERDVTITNPHGLHARPAAALVAGLREFDARVVLRTASGREASAASVTGLAALGLAQGQTVRALADGPDADAALERVAELAASQFGEADAPAAPPPAVASAAQAVASGTQIVVAPARVVSDAVDTSAYVPADAAGERTRLAEATTTVRAFLLAEAGSGQLGEIARAQAVMVGDDDLARAASARIDAGAPATEAVTHAWDAAADRLAALDNPYLRERATDVRSLRKLLLRALTGVPLAEPVPEPGILVVDELDAATAAALDPALTLAVVTTTGGTTGHGVIVATSRGIPVLAGRSDLAGVADGTWLAVDPRAGEIVVAPDAATRASFAERAQARADTEAAARSRRFEPAVTRDGVEIVVEANVASLADAVAGREAGADGSGLVRTELLFGAWAQAPTAEEQASMLAQIAVALDAPITVRTWDAGGDKPMRWLPQEREANPFLGVRGVRTMRAHPDVLDAQLTAVCLVAREHPVRVMVPMVSRPSELAWVRERLEAVRARIGFRGDVPLGMMVEVPAAAVRAADFAGLVDFASIGTNDLTQYVAAADRGNGAVAALAEPGLPAVLDLIAATCRGLTGVPVAVCGDLASDPTWVPALVERGVRELSVRPGAVPAVKDAVRSSVGTPLASPVS